ncbi:aspartyl/asparaginyl beta-hydroxylase [Sergentomyia squamirostris]
MSEKPRKRKDKKKKEDSDVGESAASHPSGVQSMGPDDVQLHVHKDHGTGGHWCAKIVFFSLMAILAGLVGLIILENRGLSDVDTPLSESRFSEILEGWVDENRAGHDDHEHDILASLEELDEHDEHEEPFEEEDEHDEEDHDEDEGEDEHDNDEDDDQADEEEDEVDEDGEEGGADEDDEDQEDDADDEDEEDQEDELDEENQTNELEDDNEDANEDDDDQPDNLDDENEDDNNDDDDDQPDNPDDDDDDDNNNEDDQDDGENDDDAPFEEHVNNKVPLTKKSDLPNEKTEDIPVQIKVIANNTNKVNMTEQNSPIEDESSNDKCKLDDDGSFEEVIDNDAGEDLHLQKIAKKVEPQEEDDDDEPASPSSSLAEKLVIGLALIVVAHSVLLRKTFNRGKDGEAEAIAAGEHVENVGEDVNIDDIDMRRRLTIPTAEEPLPDPEEEIIYADEEDELVEYSDEEIIEEEEEIVEDIEEYEDEVVDQVEMPATFEELNAMYKPKEVEVQNFERPVPKVQLELPKMVESSPTVKGDEEEIEDDVGEDVGEEQEEIDYDEEEYEGSDYEAEELSDVDDTDLMKRLEEKYGKLPHQSERDEDEDEDKTWTKIPPKSGGQSLEDDLQDANDQLDDNPSRALNAFEEILKKSPRTLEAVYGRARALDKMAERQQSNSVLREAIEAYKAVIELEMVTDEFFVAAATRCINRMRFLGLHLKTIPIHEVLIERFSETPEYRNELAISYLLLNRLADAKLVLHNTLLRWRHDPVALVHYGFVLKTLDRNYEEAADYLTEGILSNAEGTQDGRFYFALGDCLLRLGRREKARAVFRAGAKKKLFLSEYQRSLYNVDSLKSKPFWSIDDTRNRRLFETLERNWRLIRDEGMKLLSEDGFFVDESESLRETGDWKQFDLFVQGQRISRNCRKAQLTCNLMESFLDARFCTRGQIKFSVMHPGTHVWPHCGPTNCRIRAHLGLKVPPGASIRVADQTRNWEEGKILIFDDSFEHEVWHNGTSVRLILIVDIWHPDLTDAQRKSLHPI